MTNDNKHGGPAFPEIVTEVEYSRSSETFHANTYSHVGMSLRDYFAAAALTGEFASQTAEYSASSKKMESIAMKVYAIADAMLAARDQK